MIDTRIVMLSVVEVHKIVAKLLCPEGAMYL